ncbi:hypothetical protein Q1695_015677 [Nippostrongylus brasiliensis]|nr:hypothetical protein Q1695_015677 [Nippostrongylus brasiliensis]
MDGANLYTVGDGLFGTHVTLADIEEDLQREFGTSASFGPNNSVTDIGDGNGFMSKILLINPDWQNKDKELPQKFIVKILTQLVIQKFSKQVSEQRKVTDHFSDQEFMSKFETLQRLCHNAEVTVYKQLAKIPAEKLSVPKVYYSKSFSESNPLKGYIIMEYLENSRGVHIFENISPEQIKEVLRYKAILEASTLDMTLEDRQCLIQNPFTNVFGSLFRKETLDTIIGSLSRFNDGELIDQAERLSRIVPEMDLSSADHMAEEHGMESVLCHGDLWSMNILWQNDGKGPKLAALVDYQVSHFGCSATDLVRVFSACLSGKDRQEKWEDLLEQFYDYLMEEVGDRKMPYTLEQLKETYRRFFPIGAFLVAPMIGPLYDAIFMSPDEDKKKKCLEIITEKTRCLVDDILHFHDRNKVIKDAIRDGVNDVANENQ